MTCELLSRSFGLTSDAVSASTLYANDTNRNAVLHRCVTLQCACQTDHVISGAKLFQTAAAVAAIFNTCKYCLRSLCSQVAVYTTNTGPKCRTGQTRVHRAGPVDRRTGRAKVSFGVAKASEAGCEIRRQCTQWNRWTQLQLLHVLLYLSSLHAAAFCTSQLIAHPPIHTLITPKSMFFPLIHLFLARMASTSVRCELLLQSDITLFARPCSSRPWTLQQRWLNRSRLY